MNGGEGPGGARPEPPTGRGCPDCIARQPRPTAPFRRPQDCREEPSDPTAPKADTDTNTRPCTSRRPHPMTNEAATPMMGDIMGAITMAPNDHRCGVLQQADRGHHAGQEHQDPVPGQRLPVGTTISASMIARRSST